MQLFLFAFVKTQIKRFSKAFVPMQGNSYYLFEFLEGFPIFIIKNLVQS